MQSSPTVTFQEIDENHEGQRIDNFLFSRLKGVPKSHVYRIIRKGEVRVNKKRIKAEYKLVAGDVLRIPPIRIAEKKELERPSDKLVTLLKDSILYEDKDMLVLNKPSGMAVHPGTGVHVNVIDAMRQIYNEPTMELAHRIDKGTSGCLVLARNLKSLNILQDQFKERDVSKSYKTLVSGIWPEPLKVIDQPLERKTPRSGERFVEVSTEGKQATTTYKILESFSNETLLEAQPHTGRTHQIRVHCQWAGHPIIGDEKYNDLASNKLYKTIGLNRLFLHASSISLKTPSGKLINVEAPLEDGLNKALAKLRVKT